MISNTTTTDDIYLRVITYVSLVNGFADLTGADNGLQEEYE